MGMTTLPGGAQPFTLAGAKRLYEPHIDAAGQET